MEKSKSETPILKNGKKQVMVKQIAPMKLKDSLARNRIVMNLKDVFGFLPEIMIIDKVLGRTNTIQIAAVIPEGHNDKKVGEEGAGVAKSPKAKTKRA